MFSTTRPRRLRTNPQMRELIRETQLNKNQLVMPLFIHHGHNIKNPIQSMPGQFQWSLDRLDEILTDLTTQGLNNILLFGIPKTKDAYGSDAYDDEGIIAQAIRYIKKQAPQLLIIADCCFCEYTDHGHCGVVHKSAQGFDVDNDATLDLLARQAITLAKAGADIIAPSGMMDNMIAHLREALDTENFQNISLLSYAVKYASAYYGPFREAAQGTPQFGDRKTYQMDPANRYEAIKEAALDAQQGADMLMVKPAINYLDIIHQIKNHLPELPLAAYHVSGEYAMLKAAAEKGWLDEKTAVMETLMGIKRAGADIIITYYALEVAKWLACAPSLTHINIAESA